MINYWWVTRPKRRLDSVPQVLSLFAQLSYDQMWSGDKSMQIAYEDALESAGLKRVGERRDQGGSGARTYYAWLKSLGLIFKHSSTGHVMLTLAGEAIMSGDSPVDVLSEQIWKYQFPSAFSVSRGVNLNPKFRIHPFLFLLKLLMDPRIGYLTEKEIAVCVIYQAVDEKNETYESIVDSLQTQRACGTISFPYNIPAAARRNAMDIANTLCCWLEYTQVCHRMSSDNHSSDNHSYKRLVVLEDKREEAERILSQKSIFIDRPEDEEYFQRKYGVDPKHTKDTRNLTDAKTITNRIIQENLIRSAYIRQTLQHPIYQIDGDVIDSVCCETALPYAQVEDYLREHYPNGSISAFLSAYHEMAFSGRDKATKFEEATTDIFRDVFHFDAKHLGQTGSLSAPDVLLISDPSGYQAIIDTKAYSQYSVSGDHHNRMVHNYIEHIANYSACPYPIGFFSYIAGGLISTISGQIQREADESGVNGSAVTVDTFIAMIEKAHQKPYTHDEVRKIFGCNRQITARDL